MPCWLRCGGPLIKKIPSIVSNSHLGKRLVVRDMTICESHGGPHVSENVCCYWWFVHSWAAKPSPRLIFGLLTLPCGRFIQKCNQNGSVHMFFVNRHCLIQRVKCFQLERFEGWKGRRFKGFKVPKNPVALLTVSKIERFKGSKGSSGASKVSKFLKDNRRRC